MFFHEPILLTDFQWNRGKETYVEGYDDAGRVIIGQLDGSTEESMMVRCLGYEPGSWPPEYDQYLPSASTQEEEEEENKFGLPVRLSSLRRTERPSAESTRLSSPNSGV